MKSKLLKIAAVIVVVLMILLVAPTAFALPGDTGTDGDFNWEELSDGTVAVTAYNGAGGAVTVPASLGGKTVSEIRGHVFQGNGTITSVVIEASISELPSNSFAGCSSLESVTLPTSVTKLGGSVFSGCIDLNTLPSIGNVTSIGDAAFAGCSSLPSGVVPSGVTTLGMALFQDCTALTDLEIACDQPAGPYNIFSIYDGCTALKNVTFSGDWTTIGAGAFVGYSTLETVSLPEGLLTIDSGAFLDCTSLDSINIPSTVTTINHQSFGRCISLPNITLPSGLETLGDGVFENCTFTNAKIPASVTTLGNGIYASCTSLTDLEFACDQPAGSYNAYSIYQGCPLETVTFSGNWTTIGAGAFSGFTTIQTVSLPEGLETIDSSAFDGCTSLSTINIPSTVTTINSGAFHQCASLPNVTLPAGLTTLNSGTFARCSSMTQAKIPASVTTLGTHVYENCTSLTDLEFACDQPPAPHDTRTIYNGCTALKNVIFSGSWTEIKDGAFAGFASIETVSLPEGLTTIGDGAFISCSVLENINIPSTVTQIGDSAFGYCSSLASISLPNSSITFGGGAFNACTALTEVTLPANMTMIGDGMFDGCTALTRANFITTSAAFGSGIFGGSDINSDGMYGFDGSTAQAYALANSHPFHLLQTISFNSQGGSAVSDVYQAAGQTIDEPTKPTKSGYEFGGWYDALDYTDKITFPYIVNTSVTMYAKWDKLYTISFDSQGGGSVADKTGIIGATVSEPTPMRSGYEFGGWFETSSCTGTRVSFPYSIAGDKLLYAKWDKLYTISFDSQGGSSVADKTGIMGATISEPIPTRSGYNFDGWFETSSCTGTSVSFPYAISGDKLLYAKWEVTPDPTPTPSPIENPETGQPTPILYALLFIGAIAAVGSVILWRSRQTD